MEYGNGIVGDMCVHMLDMVRWMLGLGWPKSVSSKGGILVQKQGRANISDTQSALFDFGDLTVCEKNSYYAMQRRATSHAPVSEVNMETTPLHPRAGLKEMSSFSIEGNLHTSS